MKAFRARLSERQTDGTRRRWLYVPYDQLSDAMGPLSREDPRELGIVLVEAPAKAARRPYHKQKLALVLANQRHFALEQAARGVAVRYEVAAGDYASALRGVCAELGPLRVMEPAERELRRDLAPLVAEGRIEIIAHEGWLSQREDFVASVGNAPPYRMDAFYRRLRARTGILMVDGKPEGGKFSFDAENRRPYRGEPQAPTRPVFAPDAITREVCDLIERHFAQHPGELHADHLPATRDDAERLWRFALAECIPQFGPFEDAMSREADTLFHTCVSPLLNLHRILPARVVADVAAQVQVPLASREGFVRQVLGWREFVRHVHVETDGFRGLPDGLVPTQDAPGDGGYAGWRGHSWPVGAAPGDGGAAPSVLGANMPVPPAYWGTPSGLACLDHVVASVWRDGFSHHITRLMVLSNLATLLGLSPRDLTDWFWVAYIDAYDWVVEPNVLGMGTFAVGELMTTKPYVSGAAYLHKMSDYCGGCAFDPKKNCPITRLYWAFLGRHADRFAKNPRTSGPVASLRRRSDADRAEDARVFDDLRGRLARGEKITPASAPSVAKSPATAKRRASKRS
jgi:deoxyribodipyrimidine photolyase-related protein